MSRSYKKHPYYTDNPASGIKRIANKIVRQYKHKIANGKAYKRLFCSYDIHDWITRWPWAEAKKEYERNPWPFWKEEYPTIKDFYKYWSKYHKRK